MVPLKNWIWTSDLKNASSASSLPNESQYPWTAFVSEITQEFVEQMRWEVSGVILLSTVRQLQLWGFVTNAQQSQVVIPNWSEYSEHMAKGRWELLMQTLIWHQGTLQHPKNIFSKHGATTPLLEGGSVLLLPFAPTLNFIDKTKKQATDPLVSF